jgi:molybdenum cofactor cytidylyltransferase
MTGEITVILLAAGESRRMGQPKLLLPWGETTVLGQVVTMFTAGLLSNTNMDKRIDSDNEILVVTGGVRELVEAEVARLAERYPLRAVYNPEYAQGGMLSSIQAGLAALGPGTRAALIGLGDQPQVQEETVRHICATFAQTESPIVIPSFHGRRGHPWLATRLLWPEILAFPPSTTPRQFLDAYTGQIEYVAADKSILQDLDTPEDYNRQRP